MAKDKERVLVVDDNEELLNAYSRFLTSRGLEVETATNGRKAIEKLDGGAFATIVSDMAMPQMDGMTFLRAVRERDHDVPVILITGQPDSKAAAQAMEFGAFRYLAKPVAMSELFAIVQRAMRLRQMAQVKREAIEVLGGGAGMLLGDRGALESAFDKALEGMYVVFQPVVSWKERRTFGYEALLRTTEESLPTPPEILEAAGRLGRLHAVGRSVRRQVARSAPDAPPDATLFVNIHSDDLVDDDLYSPATPLSGVASRVVLELTERSTLDVVPNLDERMKRLRELGFRIAVDDIGAGYAGLACFVRLEPTLAKIDGSLIRGIDKHPRKQSIVRSIVSLGAELGIQMVAEAVEKADERDALVAVGCDLFQGYLFGRPERGFTAPSL